MISWCAGCRELEKQEKAAREKEKEEKRRVERSNRDRFRDLMKRHLAEGLWNGKSRWKEYLPHIADDPAYLAAEKNTSGSRPKDLFQVQSDIYWAISTGSMSLSSWFDWMVIC